MALLIRSNSGLRIPQTRELARGQTREQRRWTSLALLTTLFIPWIACTPVDVLIYRGEETPAAAGGSSPVDPIEYNLGGNQNTPDSTTDSEVDPPSRESLLDDFEDGDTKSTDPGGWWYIVNDGTGHQELQVISLELDESAPRSRTGNALRSTSESFSLWGSALGVDIGDFAFPEGAFEVSFSIAASRTIELTFHALDGSKRHFTRTIEVTPAWSSVTVRLDNQFLVEDGVVIPFDETTATELQWFVFEFEAVTVWLDDVVLRTY